MGFIYKITNPINMTYVGQTHDLRSRINGYSRYHKDFFKESPFMISLIRDSFYCFGFENHVFQILEMDVPLHLLAEKERYWIDKLNACLFDLKGGMNVKRGGDGIKYKKGQKKEVYYEGFEKWDLKPFTGAEFLEKSKILKSEFNRQLNIKLGKTFPEWSNKKVWDSFKKKVVLYDKGVFVAVLDSTIDCAKFLEVSRSSVKDSLIKGSWIRCRYKANYYTEDYPLEIPFNNVRTQGGGKIVYMFDKNMVFLKEFESAEIAGKYVGLNPVTVRRNASTTDLAVTQKGYIFVYKDLYESMTSQKGGG